MFIRCRACDVLHYCICSYRTEEERRWVEAVPLGLHQKLANMVLVSG